MTIGYTAVDSQLMYGEESAWGTGVATAKVFGNAPNLESFSMNKNYVPSRGSGNREAVAMKQGRYDASFSISFDMTSDLDWLQYVLTTKAGSPTNSWTAGGAPKSLTVAWTRPQGATNAIITMTGCVISNAEVDINEGEVIRVTLSFNSKRPVITTGSALVPTYANESLTFADACLTVGATTYELVQSVNVGIETGCELRGGLCSTEPTAYRIGGYTYGISITHMLNSVDELLGSAVADALLTGKIRIMTGATTYIDIDFTDAGFNTYDTSAVADEDITETVEALPLSIEISTGSTA